VSVKNTRQMATKQELPQERKQLRYQLLKPWLGREDSNLRMAESKSKWFALFVKTHSEKMREFDLNPIKRLADISECRLHVLHLGDAASCPPKAEVTSSNLVGRAKQINQLVESFEGA
jgi:hypothetical protein